VTNLSKPDGTLQARYRWDAWGNLRSQAGSSFNLFGFTGYQKDGETGLYYAQARFYDPELGRFLSEDPQDGKAQTPPSLHRYLYAYANPAVFWDPRGEEARKKEEDRSRVLMPGEKAPPGWTVQVVDEENGIRIAIPPAHGPADVPEEPSWWEKLKKKATKAITEMVESVTRPAADKERFGEAFDRNSGSTPTSSDEEEDVRTAQQAKTGIAEVSERGKDLSVSTAKAVNTGVTVSQAGAGAVVLVKLIRDGIVHYVERRAVKAALAEGWALAEAKAGQSVATAEAEVALAPYEEGLGHHIPAKSGFRGDPAYNASQALAVPKAELERLGINHARVTGAQATLYRQFAATGRPLTWADMESIERQALVASEMDPATAEAVVQRAISELKAAGVKGPTRIPWGGS
jgi:RHS repeat-associated protein